MANSNNNNNLFGFNNDNFTNDFFHLNNPNQRFLLPYTFNGNKGHNLNIKEDVPVHNAKTIDLSKIQANPNAFNENTRKRDLIDLLSEYIGQFDEKAKYEYSTIRSWKTNNDKRYEDVDRLYDAIRDSVQTERNVKRAKTGRTEGYKQEWEDKDIVETFSRLIKSREYQDIKNGNGYDPKKKTSKRYRIPHPKNR